MIGGLLAGAMAGGGKAVQQNAQSTLEARRQEALTRLDNELAFERQENQQEFTAGENEQNRAFRAGESEADRAQRLQLAQMQERGANSRAAAGRNDWNMMQTADGTPVRINARTGTMEPIAGSDKFTFGDGGALTDRQKASIDMLSSEKESIMEQSMGSLSEDQATRLGEIDEQLESMLGQSGGSGLLDRIRRELGLDGDGSGQGGDDGGEGGDNGGGSPPPPRSIRGRTEEIQSARRETEASVAATREASEARDAADALLERIGRERRGGASRGGLLSSVNQAAGRGGVSQEAMAEAQQIADRILSLDSNDRISSSDQQALADRLARLQKAGVPVNLNQ